MRGSVPITYTSPWCANTAGHGQAQSLILLQAIVFTVRLAGGTLAVCSSATTSSEHQECEGRPAEG